MKQALYGGREVWKIFGISHGKFEMPVECPCGIAQGAFQYVTWSSGERARMNMFL